MIDKHQEFSAGTLFWSSASQRGLSRDILWFSETKDTTDILKHIDEYKGKLLFVIQGTIWNILPI